MTAALPKLYSADLAEESPHYSLPKVDQFVAELLSNFTDEERRVFLDIPRCMDWIRQNRFKRVALQLPDAYLCLSSYLASTLESATNAKTFVLADTAYRSCCIDLVAAEHADADSLIHFGDSCLSDPSDKLPILYIFGRLAVPRDAVRSALSSSFQTKAKNQDIVVVVDTVFSHSYDDILEDCQASLPGQNVHACPISSLKKGTKFGRIVPEVVASREQYVLLFFGLDDSPLSSLWLMTYPSCSGIVHFNPVSKTVEHVTSNSRMLRKRLFLTEKVRDANTVALVIGTLGVCGHRDAVQRMRQLCATSRKQLYVISVGKLNVAKVSNFATDVDVFVLLSCPYGVMLDTSDYYRPIVSFFEAENALNPSKLAWMADQGWSPDFGDSLNDEIGELQEDNADVSLITGRVRAVRISDEHGAGDSGGQVALYSAGDYFNARTWKGLDGSCDNSGSSLKMEEGRSGIAAHYQCEPNK